MAGKGSKKITTAKEEVVKEAAEKIAGKKTSKNATLRPSESRSKGKASLNESLLPTISLCMIVRNEAINLPACLESVTNVVDEIIIVDTGSNDETKEIAQNFGAKVSDFKWVDDFSAARNFGIDQATKEWIIIMDADDRLTSESRKIIKEQLLAHRNEVAFDVWIYDTAKNNKFTSIRIFKNFLGINYYRPIHEQVYLGEAVKTTQDPSLKQRTILDIEIDHMGNEDITPDKNKSKRNIRLLKRTIKKYPKDTDMNYYLGAELLSLGKTGPAIENFLIALDSYLDRDPKLSATKQHTLLPRILFALINAYIYEKDIEGILDVCDFGVSIYPTYGDLFYRAGSAKQLQQKHSEAISYFNIASKNFKPPFINFPSTPSLKLHALRGMATSYFYLDDLQNAEKYYIKALKEDPSDLSSIQGLAYSLRDRYETKVALKKIEKYADLENKELYAEVLRLLTDLPLQF